MIQQYTNTPAAVRTQLLALPWTELARAYQPYSAASGAIAQPVLVQGSAPVLVPVAAPVIAPAPVPAPAPAPAASAAANVVTTGVDDEDDDDDDNTEDSGGTEESD
jgi:hypothetical protein